MIDLARIEGFDWDDGNSRKSAEKHAVSQGQAEQVFLNEPLLVVQDRKHSDSELRFHALGRTDDGRHLHVTFTLREDGRLIRVISARDMNRKERAFLWPSLQ
ncbi:MAG: BrnT family toxin [Rhizobiales bacterium]|nr:BrnT family toxin [Hyphomicrobiales bacterium]MDQ3558757.1 BrnT family toxin [Pseudomonadota bacterium]